MEQLVCWRRGLECLPQQRAISDVIAQWMLTGPGPVETWDVGRGEPLEEAPNRGEMLNLHALRGGTRSDAIQVQATSKYHQNITDWVNKGRSLLLLLQTRVLPFFSLVFPWHHSILERGGKLATGCFPPPCLSSWFSLWSRRMTAQQNTSLH